MKEDIDFPKVKGVHVVMARKDGVQWEAFLINRSGHLLETILVSSNGYGQDKHGKKQKTSTLRHAIPRLEHGSYALLEPIQSEVFHLTNEYWVSYYIKEQIYDKKFLFVPDSILDKNLIYIPELEIEGVLHD